LPSRHSRQTVTQVGSSGPVRRLRPIAAEAPVDLADRDCVAASRRQFLAVEWRYGERSTEDPRHAQSHAITTTVAFLGQRRGPGVGQSFQRHRPFYTEPATASGAARSAAAEAGAAGQGEEAGPEAQAVGADHGPAGDECLPRLTELTPALIGLPPSEPGVRRLGPDSATEQWLGRLSNDVAKLSNGLNRQTLSPPGRAWD
jgi:hypothetical protein